MSKFENKVVLITGASSGIGRALAIETVKQGGKVVAIARRLEKLDTLKAELKEKVCCVKADVTDRPSLDAAVEEGLSQFSKIDVVIANAGFGVSGLFCRLQAEDYRRQFETNVFGVLNTIYSTLEPLKKTKGSIGIIGSVAGYTTLSGMGAYSMSKYAIRAFAESLYLEMKYFGISVTHIAPGFIESEIRQVNNQGQFQDKAAEPLSSFLLMKTDKAARQMLSAIRKRKAERVITNHGKVIIFLKRHFPCLWRFFVSSANIKGRTEPA